MSAPVEQNVPQPSVTNQPKKNVSWIFIPFVALILLFLGVIIGGFYFLNKRSSDTKDTTSQVVTLDEQKAATHLSKILDTKDAYWQRMFRLFWNDVEKQQGEFDWSVPDERMEEFMDEDAYPVITVEPFANWDQDACHGDEYISEFDSKKGGTVKVGKPCDMTAYEQFLTKSVERYDGDGVNDMPDLTVPVKYWAIVNEPSMQDEPESKDENVKFFMGTPQEYVDILKSSYEVIKSADPEAKVLQGGMAGLSSDMLVFWRKVFDLGGGEYFDIANIHSIDTDEYREDMHIFSFKKILKEYELEDKPIWMTEVQFGGLGEEPQDRDSFDTLLAKATVVSLALGVEKLFYIQNWVYWDEYNLEESSTHNVYLNLVDKLNYFDEVTIIKEEYIKHSGDSDGIEVTLGQYKFSYKNNEIYVLWGEGAIPQEITGKVTVTDMSGESEIIGAEDIVLSEKPIFVEMKE